MGSGLDRGEKSLEFDPFALPGGLIYLLSVEIVFVPVSCPPRVLRDRVKTLLD